MSKNIEYCQICGLQSSSVISCNSCWCLCCKQCLTSHRSNNVCQLIADHCVGNVCDIHKEIRHSESYCLECSKRICDKCHSKHANHDQQVVCQSEAMAQIKEDLQSLKHNLYATRDNAVKKIHIVPETIRELNDTQVEIEAKSKIWRELIFERSVQLVDEVTEDMNLVDKICGERQIYVDYVQNTIQELISLEKISFPLTFLAIWMRILQKLSKIKEMEVNELSEKKIFKAKLEDSSRLTELFGLYIRESDCQSEIGASDQTSVNEMEQLANAFSLNVTIQENDDEDKRKHQLLTSEMNKLQDEVKKLQAENMIGKSSQLICMSEKKRLDEEVKQLQTEKGNFSIEKGLLTLDRLKMHKSVQDLYMFVLNMHSKQEFRERSVNVTEEKPIPEMIEFIKNSFIMKQGLTKITKNEECEDLKEKVALLEEHIKEAKNADVKFQMETSEMLQSIFSLRDYVTTIQSKDLTHETIDQPVTKSVSNVVDIVLKHICSLNEKVMQLSEDLSAEIAKTTELTKTQANDIELCKHKYVTMFTSQIQSKEKTLTELRDSNQNLQQQIKKLQDDTLRLEKQNAQIFAKYKAVCKEKDDLTEGTNSVQMVMDENEQSMKKLLAEMENMKKMLSDKETQVKLAKEDMNKRYLAIKQLRHQLEERENTISGNNRTINHLKDIIADHEKTITAIKNDKDDLQTRLSSVAGEKLTQGNAAITDLGDPNRPMKVGEKYGELYDNEWTDAMENITTVKAFYSNLKDSEIEEIIICHLHRLLKCCYAECLSKADDQIKTLLNAFTETTCLTLASKEDIDSLRICKEAIALRKLKSDEFAKFLFENKVLCKTTIDNWNYSYKNEEVMKLLMTSTFFEKCIHLCWSMVIQDPVMYLDEDLTSDTPFDKNTYKEFVRSGDKVAYVVWPALFLHKDGPLLYKGVVQAYWQ